MKDDDDWDFTESRSEIEAPIEDDVVAFAENRGWLVRKMQYPGRRGCPDRWFFKAARVVIMEFKRQYKRRADPTQVREHERYAEAGFKVHIVNDRDTAARLLGYDHYERD
jgi:hypothetical protein